MRRGFEESRRRHEADTLTVLVFSVWTFPAKSRPFWIAQLQIAIMGYSWANINLPPEHPIIAILKNTILNGRPPYRRTDLPIARRRPRLQSYKSARYVAKHRVLIWWLKRRTAKRVVKLVFTWSAVPVPRLGHSSRNILFSESFNYRLSSRSSLGKIETWIKKITSLISLVHLIVVIVSKQNKMIFQSKHTNPYESCNKTYNNVRFKDAHILK